MRTDVVLLPGLHGTPALFDTFIALAPPWARCRATALPVHGPQDVDALVAALEPPLRPLERFVLFGESFSGPIAARLAAKLGSKVSLLVLCNPLIEAPVAIPPALTAWLVRSRFTSPMTVAWAMTGGDRVIARSVIREVRSLPVATLVGRLEAVASARAENVIGDLTAPLLAIVGTADRLLPFRTCRELVSRVPLAVIHELNVPHLAAQVAPVMIWQAITSEFESAA